MKKIDLHIHTVATISDAPFEFGIQKLLEYISDCKLDAIAITNHNLFDLEQFTEIKSTIKISVFPGIEVSLAGGHILVITDPNNVTDFSSRCLEVTNKIKNPESSLSIQEFKEIYADLNKYLIIPHYQKPPEIPKQIIDDLSEDIYAGEVSSAKKFSSCIKNLSCLVPVLFSDCRISTDLAEFPQRQTYINCGDTTLGAIKNCLADKTKVSLSSEGKSDLIEIFKDGLVISNGLNVVVGERSSGKSYTLEKIFKENPDVKFIRQFSLIESSNKADEEKFNKMLAGNQSLFSQDYLSEFQNVVMDMLNCDIAGDSDRVQQYIESLKKYAKESEKFDSFSKAKMFSEEEYSISDSKGLVDLINSIENLIENIEFRSIILKHIELNKLKNLIVELMVEYGKREVVRLKKIWINDLVKDIRNKLRLRTAVTPIAEIDLYGVPMNLERRDKFDKISKLLQTEQVIMEKSIQGFKVIAKKCSYVNATDLKTAGAYKGSMASVYPKYNNPYDLLVALKETSGIPQAEIHKYFCKICYSILNKDGFNVSGGERSEFNLLQQIEDAQSYEMLLIDEPESSFDNIFLKNEVNSLIKEISKTMPVVIVTHNNTIGISIRPDYVLYAKKEKEENRMVHRVYSGYPTDQMLKSPDGAVIRNINVTLDCLEGGSDTYSERRRIYESIEN